jgi:hypothetical protein
MQIKRSQAIALIVVLVVLALVLMYQRRTPAVPASESSNLQSPRSSGTTGKDAQASGVGEVKLGELTAPRPAPLDNDRNPFRFKPKPPPPPPPTPVVSQPPPVIGPPPPPPGPPPPPPPPPITVKFIGIVDAPSQIGRVAVLSDKGAIDQGKEGAIVFGQYRIIKIGVESIELSYVDGRGRTTIRLTG